MQMRKSTKLAKPVDLPNDDSANAVAGAAHENISGFRLIDFLIIVLFLSVALISLNMFRVDLMHTISLRNVEPVGNVVIRKNIVQRRLVDRVLWDRLATESPVYMGDLIRVADLSSAILYIEGSSIDLSENTIIRIMRAADGESLQIMMSEGNLSLATTSESGKISLDINGLQVQTDSGTVLSVKSEENNIRLQVNEGSAQFKEDGVEQQVSAGSLVAFEIQPEPAVNVSSAGSAPPANTIVVVREVKTAAVINPASNARYINSTNNPFTVNFSWNKNNFNSSELMRLEIAADRNFNRIVSVRENLDRQTTVAVDNGLWYWRLSYNNTVYDEGRFSVTDGAGTRLQSPALSSVFKFTDDLPVLNFNWDEKEDASSYLLEISETPDFVSPKIRRQSPIAFYTDSSFGEGIWYWRVMPVFPSVYTGNSAYSQVSHFRVERVIPPPQISTAAVPEAPAEQLSLSEWLVSEIPSAIASVLISVPEIVSEPEVAPELEPIAVAVPEPEIVIPSQVAPVVPAPVAPVLRLSAPAQRARIEGLTAVRQQTVFTWDCEAEIVSSRFVLSKNSNPFQGSPVSEIRNPGRNVSISRLGEGTYYWNVEVRTADGFTVRAAQHGIVQITAIPVLPAATGLQPVRGRQFTMNDLISQRALNFSWQAVSGANAYILTIYHQSAGGRRQILQTQPLTRTNYSLENLQVLDAGTFIWQVEAINRRSNGTIDQRGTAAESTFVMDIYLPGSVKIEGAGIQE